MDRRAFLESVVAAAAWMPFGAPAAPARSGRKAVLVSMLPADLSYAERFALARASGFDAVEMQTVADRDTVTARTLLGSKTVSWADIDGLRFGKRLGAYAQLKNGGELRLPAVTFATLPLLTEASGGRVPNPYK